MADRNKIFLLLFTIYQIVEILVLITFVYYTKVKEFDIDKILFVSSTWFQGVGFQYFLSLLFWLSDNKYFNRIRKTSYCCFDLLFTLVPLFFCGFLGYNGDGYLYKCLILSLPVIYSKWLFFNVISKKYDDL